MSILFVNGSPNRDGNTAALAKALLKGKEYDQLDLIDYKIYGFGQSFDDDQFREVIGKMKEYDTIVLGSPLYWHNLCGLVRNFLDRCYGPVEPGTFSGKKLYFLIQGMEPKEEQLRACDGTIALFARVAGFEYEGMINTVREAEEKSSSVD